MAYTRQWTPGTVASVGMVGQRRHISWCMLVSLLGYFWFLVGHFKSTEKQHASGSVVVAVGAPAPDKGTLTASEALAHTLKLLNPSSQTVRALAATEKEKVKSEQRPIPICSQSKYLCQVYSLHGPPPDGHRVAATRRNWPNGVHEVEERSSVRGIRSSIRLRRLASIPFKISKPPRHATTNAQKRSERPGAAAHENPVLVESLPIKIPSFTQVPQTSPRGGLFLPLRLRAFFSDFPLSPDDNGSHGLSNWRGHTPAGRDRGGAQGATSGDSSHEEQPAANFVYYSGSDNGAMKRQHVAERLNDVTRFFQLEVVPAAIWWLQRIATVDRLLGPLVIKLQETMDDQYVSLQASAEQSTFCCMLRSLATDHVRKYCTEKFSLLMEDEMPWRFFVQAK